MQQASRSVMLHKCRGKKMLKAETVIHHVSLTSTDRGRKGGARVCKGGGHIARCHTT